MSHAQAPGARQPWVMPGWMEPYRGLIGPRSRPLEDHMNHPDGWLDAELRVLRGDTEDHDENVRVRAQVNLLIALYERGELGALRSANAMHDAIERALAIRSNAMDADRQIEAHVNRGDNAATIFYAGASLALTRVRETLRDVIRPSRRGGAA